LVNPTSLTGWTVNSTTKAASFTMPTGLVQIRLNFKPVDRTITITGVTGGTVTASNGTATKTVTTTTGTLTVAGGDLITITSVPGTGYRFLKWTSPTTPAPADANASVTTFTMPQSNVTVTASFVAKTPDLYSVGTAVNNSTGGSAKVTAEGSTTAITSAEAGVGVTFTPTPSSDWNFSNWTVKSGTKPYGFGSSSTNASSPLTVAMPSSDLVLQANFTQKLHYITASKNPTATTGSFTVDPSNALTSGSGQITGTAVTLTAPTSDVSKVFTGWTLSGLTLTNSTTTSSNPIKFNMPANDTSTATANYTAAAITTSATSLAAHTSDTGSASANNKTFTVTSNIPWKVAYPTNFSGSPTAGTSQAAGTNVTVTVWPTSANTSGDTDRTGNVTVSAYNSGTGAADKTVAVTQSHATTTWTVSPTTTQAFASTEYDSGVAHTITVTSNATWKATSNSTNFTVVMRNSAGTTQSTSVTGNGTVLVYPASVNTTTTARTATLTIAGTIETSKSTAISLSQAGMLTASAAVSPTSSGTVKINGGTAAAAPSATFHSGTSVNFEAVPATNYRFVKWSNGSTSNPLTLTNQTAGVTLTATFAVHKDGSSPYLLYWDEASQTMQLGLWTSQGGNANSNNQLLFQFGSVVGMTNTATADGTAWPGTSTIKFNPTSTATTSFTWTTIPNWNGTDTTDGYISSSSYHTLANVQAGRGDPCKLVGLTVAQIKAGVYDSGRYRLPTASENEAYDSPEYTGGTSGWSSTPVTAGIYYLPVSPNKFLPATGRRDASDGATNYVGTVGNYWSSRASSGTAGYSLFFNSNSVYPDYAYSARIGFPVRCVLQ
jgi:hypothetical protein